MTNKYTQYGTIGNKAKDIKEVRVNEWDSALIIYNNGEEVPVDFRYEEDRKKAVKEFLRTVFKEDSWKEVCRKYKGERYFHYQNNKALKNTIAALLIAGAAGIGGSALATGLGKDDNNKVNTTTVIEHYIESNKTTEDTTEKKEANKVDLTDKSWDEIQTMIANGELNEVQAKNFTEVFNWLNKVNASEDWENLVLTDEEVIKVNEILEANGYPKLDGNEVRFGFDSKMAIALKIAYGKMTNEEIYSLLSGAKITQSELDDQVRDAEKLMILYYQKSEKPNLYLNELITDMTEEEINAFDSLNTMFTEYKSLKAEGKDEEAKAKFLEIKDKIILLNHSEIFEEDALLKLVNDTAFTASSLISAANRYTVKIEINALVDAETQKYETLTREVDAIDEIMVNQIFGLQKDAEEKFKKKYNINSNYQIPSFYDIDAGINDALCSEIDGRIEEYNEYNEYKDNDEDRISLLENTVNAVDQYYDAIDSEIENLGKDPKNIQYFEGYGMQMEFNLQDEFTFGKIGDILPGYEAFVGHVEIDGDIVGEVGQELEAEKKKNEEAMANEKATKEAETQQIQASVDHVFEITKAYFLDGKTDGYDPSWENSSDEMIRNAWKIAKESGENEKYVRENPSTITGGEQTNYTDEQLGSGKTYESEQETSSSSTYTETVIDEKEAAEGKAKADASEAEVNNTNNNTTTTETTPNEEARTVEDAANEQGIDTSNIDAWWYDIEIEGDIEVVEEGKTK